MTFPQSRVERRVLAGSVAVVVVFILVTALAVRSAREMASASVWVSHTREVLADLEAIEAAIEDAESSARGFALSADPAFRDRHLQKRRLVDDRLALLRQLTADNPAQQQRREDLRRRIVEKNAVMDDGLAATAQGGIGAALRNLATGRGPAAMAAVLRAIDGMRAEENRLLAERSARMTSTIGTAEAALIAVGIVGSAFLTVGFGLVLRYVGAQARAQQALESSEERFRLVIDRMIAGLVITSERGKIESINPAALRMFGYTADEIVGRYFKRLVAVPEGAAEPDVERFLQSVMERGLGQVTEWQGRRREGGVFPLELSLFEFRTEEGRHLAGIVRDISERREIDRMKDEFISVVSHELRTPLTSIRGAIQLVLAERPTFQDPEHEPLLNIALSNCERLIRIINDILDVSKIEAGQVQLKIRCCEVDEIVRSSIESVNEMARASSVRLVAEVSPALPPLLVDYDRAVQMCVNLLSNAVKFAPAQSVVTIGAREVPGGIAISVRDRGQGIAGVDLGKLFRKFKQLDSSATRRAGGTGLGLSIVKALAEQHGGSVSVVSTEGEGATFTVTLPAALRLQPRQGALSPAGPGGQGRGETILVVDDDPDIRRVLRGQLEVAGYQVVEATDGESAVRTAIEAAPSLITMDLVMPGIGGLSAIQLLGADPRTADIPVVIVSALASTVSVAPTLTVIPKPVSSDRLLREIELLVGRAPNGTILLAEDDDDLRNVMSRALTRRGFHVLTASDGDVARQLYDATRCDMILLDLHMPQFDGFSLIEHIRSSPDGRELPIVVISGSNTGQGERRAMALGANVYIAKPVDADSLVPELKSLLARLSRTKG